MMDYRPVISLASAVASRQYELGGKIDVRHKREERME